MAGTFFFVVYAVVITITRPGLGVLFDRKGENFVLYPCYIALAIGLWLISVAHTSWVLLLAGVFVGLGYGTFMSNGQAVCVKLVPIPRDWCGNVYVFSSPWTLALALARTSSVWFARPWASPVYM